MRTIPTLEGRIIEGFSMGGYGAARLGFTYPDLFGAVSMFGAGPLHPDFEVLPSNAALRERVLESVYGGELDYFRALSPWRIAERNSPLLGGLPLRLAIGTRDATLPANRDFHRHLSALGIPNDYVEVPGVAHEPSALIEGLGDQMWAFYRSVLGSI
jgi:S-formylglutathione hydrolase FrmB